MFYSAAVKGKQLHLRVRLAFKVLIYRSTASDKYKAARNSKTVKCVSFEWVKDSISKGYALPFSAYPVKKGTSTPTKGNEDVNPDFSMMSVIAPPRSSEKSVLQETVNVSSISQINAHTPISLKRKSMLLFLSSFAY